MFVNTGVHLSVCKSSLKVILEKAQNKLKADLSDSSIFIYVYSRVNDQYLITHCLYLHKRSVKFLCC